MAKGGVGASSVTGEGTSIVIEVSWICRGSPAAFWGSSTTGFDRADLLRFTGASISSAASENVLKDSMASDFRYLKSYYRSNLRNDVSFDSHPSDDMTWLKATQDTPPQPLIELWFRKVSQYDLVCEMCRNSKISGYYNGRGREDGRSAVVKVNPKSESD